MSLIGLVYRHQIMHEFLTELKPTLVQELVPWDEGHESRV